MQRPDYTSYYYSTNPNPNPSPPEFHQPPLASAPPLTADHPVYSLNYPHNPDPLATAPSFTPTSSTTAPPQPISSSHAFDHALNLPPHSFPAYCSQYYAPYDQHQPAHNHASLQQNSSPDYYSAPYVQLESSVATVRPAYDNSYPSSLKFDSGGAFSDYGRSEPDLGSKAYGKRPDVSSSFLDDGYGDGVYAYQGKVEPYGARGTASKSSTWLGFDDYGRPISLPSEKNSTTSSSGQIAKAVPKAETKHDVKDGVVKFRVKMLAESGGQSTMDVLCQIGLDGIHMLDPSSYQKLRIYPLETITGCEVVDSCTLAFWSKSSMDIEPRRIRLQSNSYTTNTLLDTITAAAVQFKEMGGRSQPSEPTKTAEQSAEKKKGFTDWVNLIKPGNEEKDHWVPDVAVSKCKACRTDFGAFIRKHHCRNCGDIFCDKCTSGRIALMADEDALPVRVCDGCMAEVTQRLSNAKEAAQEPFAQTHGDLARKLQEEMEKNRRTSSGSDSAGRRTKEVACPICTVHLQVQVPNSGSETIECGVCQHPFLVTAH